MHGQRVVFSLEKPMLSMTKPSRTTLAHWRSPKLEFQKYKKRQK
jgi:hypothetical protein